MWCLGEMFPCSKVVPPWPGSYVFSNEFAKWMSYWFIPPPYSCVNWLSSLLPDNDNWAKHQLSGEPSGSSSTCSGWCGREGIVDVSGRDSSSVLIQGLLDNVNNSCPPPYRCCLTCWDSPASFVFVRHSNIYTLLCLLNGDRCLTYSKELWWIWWFKHGFYLAPFYINFLDLGFREVISPTPPWFTSVSKPPLYHAFNCW